MAAEQEDIDNILSNINNTDKLVLDSLASSGSNIEQHNIDHVAMLKDITLNISVVLGKTDIPIKDVLALNPQSILELDRNFSEDIDIYFNDRLMAKGKLIAIDDEYGVKVTQILERVNQDDYLEHL